MPIHWTPAGDGSVAERGLVAGHLGAPARVDAAAGVARTSPSAKPTAPSVSTRKHRAIRQASGAKPRRTQLSKAQSTKTSNAARSDKVRTGQVQSKANAKAQASAAHATKARPVKAQPVGKTPSTKAPAKTVHSQAPSKAGTSSQAAPKAPVATVTPVSGGGYVFPGGGMRVAAGSRSVETVQFSHGCAAGTTTPRIALDHAGVFRYTGPLRGSIQVILVGRFIDREHASLQIRFKGALCSGELLDVTARLS